MKKNLFITFTLSIIAFSISQYSTFAVQNKPEQPVPLIQRSKVTQAIKEVNRENYPDADSVLVRDIQKVTYQQDGTSVEFDEFYQKILTEKGKRSASVFSEYFNVSYGKVIIWAIEIIKPDGEVVKIDVAKNSKVMIYAGQMGSNIYNPNEKIIKVTVPGIEIGDTLHYYVERITTNPRMKNIWTRMYILQSTTPVVYYKIIVDGPKSRPLKKYLVKDEVKDSTEFTRNESGDRIIYNWVFKNIPRIFTEPQMPHYYRYSQRLLLSTAADWLEISRWYSRLCRPHLSKVTPEMKEKVAELTKGLKTEEEKIEAVFRFVSTKIRYMGLTIETTAPGYEPHDINLTFKNRYGVCRDKAALLVGMLRLAGIKAYPVLIMNGAKKDKEVPNNIFNHAITCAVTRDGRTILMDSTDETTINILPAYLSDKSYLLAKESGSDLMTSPIIPAEKNLLLADTNGEIHENGSLSASTELRFQGINDTIYRGAFSRWKIEKIEQFFASRLKSLLPGARLEKIDITPKDLRDFKVPLSIKISFSSESLFIEGKDATLMQLPHVGSSFSAVRWMLGDLGLKKRKYPLHLHATFGTKEKFTFKLPAGMDIVKLPEYKTINWKKLEWKLALKQDNNIISGNSSYLINAVEFMPNEYDKLKQNMKAIQFENRKMLILKKDFSKVKELKKLFPNAQSVIISQKSSIDIKDQSNSILTTRIEKKILSYAGVKNNSEIKFSYNPAWQKVSVNSVIVTGPKGKKFSLDKNEVNIMDQNWVGSAPRYPGGKILVVSLPGVQVGSTIEYEICVEGKDQPFISNMILFQNDSPIITKETILKYPEKLNVNISKPDQCLNISSSTEDGMIIKKWQRSNVPAVNSEIETPPEWMFVPKIVFSTGSWQDYSKKLNDYLNKATKNQIESEAMAAKLAAGKTALDTMKAIRDYVAEKIRAAGPGLSSLPLSSISSADRTLREGYGNSADRAVLLYVMLEKAGFKPEFMAVTNIAPVSLSMNRLKKFPANIFSTMLVKVVHNQKKYFFNDTSQYAKLGTCSNEGKIALKLKNAELEIIETDEKMVNQLEREYSIKLIDDGSTLISSSTFYYGRNFENENRLFSEISPEERKRYFQEAVSRIAQSAIPMTKYTTDFDTYPGNVHYAVKIPDYTVKDGKYIYFKLPLDNLNRLIPTGKSKRHNPYFNSTYIRMKIKYFIDFPEGIKKIAINPDNNSIKYPRNGGTIDINCERVSSTRLKLVFDINLKPCIVPANEYPLLVNAQTVLNDPGLATIMFITE